MKTKILTISAIILTSLMLTGCNQSPDIDTSKTSSTNANNITTTYSGNEKFVVASYNFNFQRQYQSKINEVKATIISDMDAKNYELISVSEYSDSYSDSRTYVTLYFKKKD